MVEYAPRYDLTASRRAQMGIERGSAWQSNVQFSHCEHLNRRSSGELGEVSCSARYGSRDVASKTGIEVNWIWMNWIWMNWIWMNWAGVNGALMKCPYFRVLVFRRERLHRGNRSEFTNLCCLQHRQGIIRIC